MSDAQQFRAAQEYFDFSQTAPIEKDWHILRAMQAISAVDAIPYHLVFAGGTGLARAHRLVRRMSEDVDFKIVSIDSTPLSGSQQRRQLGELRNRITAALQAVGFALDPTDSKQLRSRDSNRYTVYHLAYDRPGGPGAPLRPAIQIELSLATLRLPTVRLPVISFVAEAFGRPPEIPAIDRVSVTETAAEKLVALTRRTAMELAGHSRAPDPTLVRHIYDLHAIRNHVDRVSVIALARAIARQDAQEFKNQYPAYHADIVGETRKAIAALVSEPAARGLYESFVDAMVYGDPTRFDVAIQVVSSLVDETWPQHHHREPTFGMRRT